MVTPLTIKVTVQSRRCRAPRQSVGKLAPGKRWGASIGWHKNCTGRQGSGSANARNHFIRAVKTLLAVDDEPTNLELIQMAVEESGLDVELITAANGLEAIERARQIRPSLVLMDLKMPVLDGWTATRRLKSDPTTASIPVIALSAQAMDGDRERALSAG